MGYNSKQLKVKSTAKKLAEPKDAIVSQDGQYKYAGQITKILGNQSGTPITMKGVSYPVRGKDNLGNTQMMYPGMDYRFPGNNVTEYPMMQKGGRTPIYVDDPNDPRYRAYQDSLILYNVGNDDYKNLKNAPRVSWSKDVIENDFWSELRKDIPRKFNDAYDRLIKLNKKEPSNKSNQIPFKVGFSDMPDKVFNTYYTKYKKPVQPVKVKPKQENSTAEFTDWSEDAYNKKYPPIYLSDEKDPRIGRYSEKGNKYLYKPEKKETVNTLKKTSKLVPKEQVLPEPVIDYSVFPEQQAIYDASWDTARYLKNLEAEQNKAAINYNTNTARWIRDPKNPNRYIENPNRKNKPTLVTQPYKNKKQLGGPTPPEDWGAFLAYNITAPENRQAREDWTYGDPNQYDHYGMWDALGKPSNFEEAKKNNPDWTPDPEDDSYHGFSVNPNTGVWLKNYQPGEGVAPGNTGWMEANQHYLNPESYNNFDLVYDPELQRMRYVPKQKRGGSIPIAQKGKQKESGTYVKVRTPEGVVRTLNTDSDEYRRYYGQGTDNMLAVNYDGTFQGKDLPEATVTSTATNAVLTPEELAYVLKTSPSVDRNSFRPAYGEKNIDPGIGHGLPQWERIGSQRYPNWDSLTKEEKRLITDSGSIGRSIRSKAGFGKDYYKKNEDESLLGAASGLGRFIYETSPLSAAQRILEDPQRTIKGIGQSVLDAYSAPFTISDYFAGTETFSKFNPLTGEPYGAGDDVMSDLLEFLPLAAGASKVVKPLGKILKGYKKTVDVPTQLPGSPNASIVEELRKELAEKGIVQSQKTFNWPWKEQIRKAVRPWGYDIKEKIQDLKSLFKNVENPIYVSPDKIDRAYNTYLKTLSNNDVALSKDDYIKTLDQEQLFKSNKDKVNNRFNTRFNYDKSLGDVQNLLFKNRYATWDMYLGKPQTAHPMYDISELTKSKKDVVYTIKPKYMDKLRIESAVGDYIEEIEKATNKNQSIISRIAGYKDTAKKINGKWLVPGQDNSYFGTMGGFHWEIEKMADGNYKAIANDVWDLQPFKNQTVGNSDKLSGRILNKVIKPIKNIEVGKALGIGKPLNVKVGFIIDGKTKKIINTFGLAPAAIAGTAALQEKKYGGNIYQNGGVKYDSPEYRKAYREGTLARQVGDEYIMNLPDAEAMAEKYAVRGVDPRSIDPMTGERFAMWDQLPEQYKQVIVGNDPMAINARNVARQGHVSPNTYLADVRDQLITSIAESTALPSMYRMATGQGDVWDALGTMGGLGVGLKTLRGLNPGKTRAAEALGDPVSKFFTTKTPLKNATAGRVRPISFVDDAAGKSGIRSNASEQPVSSWSMQELPGLHLESTMNSPLNKFIKPIEKPLNKEGLISTEQALNLLKSKEGKERYEIVMRGFKEKFGDNIPKKMTEDDFVNFANASFIDEKGMIYVDDILKIIGKEPSGSDKVALIKQALGDNIPKKMDYNEFRKTVQDQLIPLERQFSTSRSNYGIENLGYIPLQQGSTLTERVQNFMNTPINNLFKKPELLENQTLILGNKSKFGRGSSAHGNPDETLGHIHFLRDAENPDVLTVTQIQSDAFQGTHRTSLKTKDQAKFSYDKQLEYYNKNKEKLEGITQLPDGSYQFADGQKISKGAYDNMFSGIKESLDLSKADLENFTQKSLLDKNHQERYLQELVNYAGERGDVNKIRVPTSETAAKVQGYSPSEGIGNDLARFKRELKAAEKAIKNAPQNELIQRQANIDHYKKQIEELSKIEYKPIYSPEHQTILKKYSEQPKTIKKLFGQDAKIVTDSKGNTWYEFDIPEGFKGTKGEIKAFALGGSTTALTSLQQKRYGGGFSYQPGGIVYGSPEYDAAKQLGHQVGGYIGNTPEGWGIQIRNIENQIGNPSTWTMDSYKMLQDKLNEYKAWRENTPEGRAVIDYHNEPNEYVIPLPKHLRKYGGGFKYQPGGEVITYKNNKDYIASHANIDPSLDPRQNEWIKEQILTGNWGYDFDKKSLVKLNKAQQEYASPEAQAYNLAKNRKQAANLVDAAGGDLRRITNPDGSTGTARMSDKAYQDYITKEVAANDKLTWQNPLMYAPGMVAAGFLNPALGVMTGVGDASKNVYEGNYKQAGIDLALSGLPFGKLFKGFTKAVDTPTQLSRPSNIPRNLSDKIIYPVYDRTPVSKEMEPFISKRIRPLSREEEIFNSFLSPERRMLNELERTTFYNQQGEIIPPPQKAGIFNPLAIADKIIPRPFAPMQLLADDSWNYYSPLNMVPGYGSKLSSPTAAYRKFGNSLDDVIDSQTLRPKGTGMGSDQVKKEGNWAEPKNPNEHYHGVFLAKMDPAVEGSNIKLEEWYRRNGVVGTTKEGNTEIPLSDPGLSFNRRLPFSSRYVPIDKQKLINKQFQLATQLPYFQSLVEKYGIWGALALGTGYVAGGKDQAKENLETLNKYSLDPVLDYGKRVYNTLTGSEGDKLIEKKGGQVSLKKYTNKNIKSSINELMKRNEALFGPKGKKYFKAYQDGGATETPTPTFTPGQQFLVDMANSPKFAERYARMSGKKLEDLTQEEVDNYRNSILQNVKTLKYAPVGEEFENDANKDTYAFYRPASKEDAIIDSDLESYAKTLEAMKPKKKASQFELDRYEKYKASYDELKKMNEAPKEKTHRIYQRGNDPYTELHEESHGSTAGNLEFKGEPFIYDTSEFNERYKKAYDEDKSYLTMATEQKARIDAARKYMLDKGFYDPTKEDFDEKTYDKLIEERDRLSKEYTQKVTDALKNNTPIPSSEGIGNQIMEITAPYSKEDTIRMFNSFVRNDVPQKENVNSYAKLGGIKQDVSLSLLKPYDRFLAYNKAGVNNVPVNIKNSVMKKKKLGGTAEAFPQQPTQEQFFSFGRMPAGPQGFYMHGGITTPEAFPQQPPANYFFAGAPWSPNFQHGMAKGGQPCYECGGRHMEDGGVSDMSEMYEYAKGGWIQDATKGMRKDKPCTGSKFGGKDCPPGSKRYNLAKTFREMAKKEFGGPTTDVDQDDYLGKYNNAYMSKLRNNTMDAIGNEAANMYMGQDGMEYNPQTMMNQQMLQDQYAQMEQQNQGAIGDMIRTGYSSWMNNKAPEMEPGGTVDDQEYQDYLDYQNYQKWRAYQNQNTSPSGQTHYNTRTNTGYNYWPTNNNINSRMTVRGQLPNISYNGANTYLNDLEETSEWGLGDRLLGMVRGKDAMGNKKHTFAPKNRTVKATFRTYTDRPEQTKTNAPYSNLVGDFGNSSSNQSSNLNMRVNNPGVANTSGYSPIVGALNPAPFWNPGQETQREMSPGVPMSDNYRNSLLQDQERNRPWKNKINNFTNKWKERVDEFKNRRSEDDAYAYGGYYAYGGGLPKAQMGLNAFGQPDAQFQGPLSNDYVDNATPGYMDTNGSYFETSIEDEQKRKANPDNILNMTRGITAIARNKQMADMDAEMQRNTLADNSVLGQLGNRIANRGRYVPTGMASGMMDQYNMVPIQQPGQNYNFENNFGIVRYGGAYEEGGAYELSKDEIDQIYAMGGSVTYID